MTPDFISRLPASKLFYWRDDKCKSSMNMSRIYGSSVRCLINEPKVFRWGNYKFIINANEKSNAVIIHSCIILPRKENQILFLGYINAFRNMKWDSQSFPSFPYVSKYKKKNDCNKEYDVNSSKLWCIISLGLKLMAYSLKMNGLKNFVYRHIIIRRRKLFSFMPIIKELCSIIAEYCQNSKWYMINLTIK